MLSHSQLLVTGSNPQEPFETHIGPLKTVVVDDSPEFLAVICDLLNLDYNIEVLACGRDGVDALELVARLRPGLLLMDIDMPRLNGFTAARIIRERFPGTRVILMSASVAPEQRTLAMSYGATGVIRKTRFHEDFTLALQEDTIRGSERK